MVSENSILMAKENIEIRVESMEKKLKELKTEIQCLPRLEKSLEHLNQSMSEMIQLMDETQKNVASMTVPKAAMNRSLAEEESGNPTENAMDPKTSVKTNETGESTGADTVADKSTKAAPPFKLLTDSDLESKKERKIAENSPEPAIFEVTDGFAKHHRRNLEIPTPAILDSMNQKRVRHGHAVREEIPRRGASSRDEEGGLVNGLIQGKRVEELSLHLVGLDCGRNMAQQVNSKVLLNKIPGDLGLNKENEAGPTTIYTRLLQFSCHRASSLSDPLPLI